MLNTFIKKQSIYFIVIIISLIFGNVFLFNALLQANHHNNQTMQLKNNFSKMKNYPQSTLKKSITKINKINYNKTTTPFKNNFTFFNFFKKAPSIFFYLSIILNLTLIAFLIKQKKLLKKDLFTNVYNKTHFFNALEKEISRAKRTNIKFALLYIDINNFKNINDSFGHNTGDLLLIKFTKKLKLLLRKEDSIFRIGGDEFSIIITNLNKKQDLNSITTRLKKEINYPFFINNKKISISISIGTAIFPNDALNHKSLIEKADLDMYKFKNLKKDKFSLHSV